MLFVHDIALDASINGTTYKNTFDIQSLSSQTVSEQQH